VVKQIRNFHTNQYAANLCGVGHLALLGLEEPKKFSINFALTRDKRDIVPTTFKLGVAIGEFL
jgi:hypothetical protein